jgi:hypothetical protein
MDTSGEYGWRVWPVSWSAIWIGVLAALAVGLIIGLLGFALGAHQASQVEFRKARLISVAFSIGGAFFAFVIGGWVAARIAGIRRAEPAMLHAAIVWGLSIPILLALSALGSTGYFGGWYAGLAGVPAGVRAVPPASPEVAEVMRNSALGALFALLLGLVGSVLGGWMASGEPMRLSYYRRRPRDRFEDRTRRVA